MSGLRLQISVAIQGAENKKRTRRTYSPSPFGFCKFARFLLIFKQVQLISSAYSLLSSPPVCPLKRIRSPQRLYSNTESRARSRIWDNSLLSPIQESPETDFCRKSDSLPCTYIPPAYLPKPLFLLFFEKMRTISLCFRFSVLTGDALRVTISIGSYLHFYYTAISEVCQVLIGTL